MSLIDDCIGSQRSQGPLDLPPIPNGSLLRRGGANSLRLVPLTPVDCSVHSLTLGHDSYLSGVRHHRCPRYGLPENRRWRWWAAFTATVSARVTNVSLASANTWYRAFRREVVKSIELEDNRFGVGPKTTVNIDRVELRCYDAATLHSARIHARAEKTAWRDGIRAGFRVPARLTFCKRLSIPHRSPIVNWRAPAGE